MWYYVNLKFCNAVTQLPISKLQMIHATSNITDTFQNECLFEWVLVWMLVYKLSGCGFESRCCHLTFPKNIYFNRRFMIIIHLNVSYSESILQIIKSHPWRYYFISLFKIFPFLLYSLFLLHLELLFHCRWIQFQFRLAFNIFFNILPNVRVRFSPWLQLDQKSFSNKDQNNC